MCKTVIKNIIASSLTRKINEYSMTFSNEECDEKFAISLAGALESAIDDVIEELYNGEAINN